MDMNIYFYIVLTIIAICLIYIVYFLEIFYKKQLNQSHQDIISNLQTLQKTTDKNFEAIGKIIYDKIEEAVKKINATLHETIDVN